MIRFIKSAKVKIRVIVGYCVHKEGVEISNWFALVKYIYRKL